MNRLNPGCWIAHEYAKQELRGEALSIEFLRAVMESAPTFPETWNRQEGADFAAMMLAR